jgi:hypothetical protein
MKHSAHHELVESNDYDGQGQLPQTVMAQTAVRSHGLAITSRAGPSMSTLRDLGEI